MPAKHILILFTDQQRYDTIGALGNPAVQTPNLDALAGDSVVFEHCITPAPVCIPARMSMFAGQYPARTGCNNNNVEMKYNGSGYYSMLTNAGYESCCVGKMHYLTDPYGSMGFDRRYTQEELAAPEDDYTKFIAQNYPWVFDYHGMRSEMYYVPQISPLPPFAHPTQWVGDRSIEFINEYDSDKPMFLMSSFVHPHPPYAPPAPFCPDETDLATFKDLIGERCSCERLMISHQDMLRTKNFYYACVSFVDYQVGRIITALKDKGMYDDTLILFASDHGDMMGDYRAIGKRSMVDPSSHVPLLIRCPGKDHELRSDVCSLVDLAPTLLSYAGVPFDKSEFDGIDLFGGTTHDFVYSQVGCGENGTYMVTDGSRKLVYSSARDRYYYFDSMPEVKNIYTPDDPLASDFKALLDEYRKSDVNTSRDSVSYEPYTKEHPHYPSRLDQAFFTEEEKAAIPEGYKIEL